MKDFLIRLRKYFITGLIFFLPLALTAYLFIALLGVTDGLTRRFVEPYFEQKFGFYFRGISTLISVFLIIIIGFIMTHFMPRKIHEFFEGLMLKVPFFKQVYPAIKEMALFLFSGDQLKSFKQVVLVEYPRKGVYSIGFLTNDATEALNHLARNELCNIFIGSTPNPLTGFVILVPKKEIIFTDMKIEEACKFIVSGGVVNP
ncbi:MAG: DUF502 domain-containing protein [Candidatus Omnitrophica bacterium]|nr:DUF502 domain-containing protein [Candidatus Omnitrophota bacterium]